MSNQPSGTITTNLFISKAEFEAKRRKEKEMKARMAIAQEQIEKDLEAEGLADEIAEPEESAGDEIQTVETVKSKGKPGRKPKAE